jgi:hypothetical protein
MIKDFKLKTLIHSSLNTEHPMSSIIPNQTKIHVFPISLPNQAIIVTSEEIGGGSQIFFDIQKQRTKT